MENHDDLDALIADVVLTRRVNHITNLLLHNLNADDTATAATRIIDVRCLHHPNFPPSDSEIKLVLFSLFVRDEDRMEFNKNNTLHYKFRDLTLGELAQEMIRLSDQGILLVR